MAEGSWLRINAVEARLDASTINDIVATELGKRAISITQRPELRRLVGEELLKLVTPFVPVSNDKGYHLWLSGRATEDGRLYWTAVNERGDDYASYVYDKDKIRWDGNYANPTTEGTYPQWVERVTDDPEQWETFITNITPLIKEAFAEND